MRILTFVFLIAFCSSSFAQNARKRDINPDLKQKIVSAIQYNFDACNREDIEDVMDSCAASMPRREEFRRETLKVFQEKDIHYSLESVEILEIRGDFALVKMVQTSYTKDRESEDADLIGYRNQTGLLTKEEKVEYLNTLRLEKGAWKLHTIVSEMKPVVSPEKAKEVEQTGCKNGNCRPTPFDLPNVLKNHGFKPPR